MEIREDVLIIYSLFCPVHRKKKLIAKQTELITVRSVNGAVKKVPFFYCDQCNRYYRHTSIEENHLKMGKNTFHDLPVYFTHENYTLIKEGAQKSVTNTIWANTGKPSNYGRGEQGSGVTFAPKGKPANPSKVQSKWVSEQIVRIHVFAENEMDVKLVTNYNNLRKAYPGIATDQMSVNQFIKKVFPSGIEQDVVLRNVSFVSSSGYTIRSVEVYNKGSSYLKKYLPQDTFLSFVGKVVKGEFIVQELRILEHPIIKVDDTEVGLSFVYDGPSKANWLYNVTNEAAEDPEKIEGELADWNAYLNWKRQLAELRIRGVKYIGFKIDIENREMTLLAVNENRESFGEFRKYLRRNEVSIFSNHYSNNRWRFEFNREYQDKADNDSGVPLTFVRFGNVYNVETVNTYDWDGTRDNAKKYREDNNTLSTRYMLQEMVQHYPEPYCIELIFELSSNASDTIDREIHRYGELSPEIEDTIAGEIYGDGYIATSQIGDFALLQRLKKAVKDLANGKSASHGLDQWLFDIKNARIPLEITHITKWQNPVINQSQKEAVEKILSVPDVCLIQGPPGTGKTTVIAEAIYQLVIRNKRVMVASQANLAVDNALERLISNPRIRAIRLGSMKKIDASVSNITEGNVLESFYDSIVDYVDQQYLRKWDKADAVKKRVDNDRQVYQSALRASKEFENKITERKNRITQIDSEINNDSVYSNLNEARNLKINLKMLRVYCKGTDDDLELMLSKEALIAIWTSIEQMVSSISKQGVYLTRVGLDISNLDDSKRIKVANDILIHVLLNANVAVKLYQKIDRSTQFGGASEELEELKIQEQKLKEKVLTNMNSAIIAEWKAVNEKIAELTAAGAGLSEKEKELFDVSKLQIVNEENKKDYLLSVLSNVLAPIQKLKETVLKTAESLSESIDKEQEEIEKRIKDEEKKKALLEEEIILLETAKTEQDNICSEVLKKYKATMDTLSQRMDYYILTTQKNNQVSIERSDWEDIFRGLKGWVEAIPDYMQEKDIFLKDYINGCNVVGISCTENARTLLENGFDDFDVVIIDEVSKATPPELLIPMLRGRKIVLVGDHRQLPPLFYEHEKTYQEVAEQQEGMDDVIVPLTMSDFNKYRDMVTASLFERYFENADSSIKETLQYQYRMHKDIMDIINYFYDDQLLDGNKDRYSENTKAHYLNIRSTAGTEMIIPDRHAYWFDSSELQGIRVFEQRKQGSTSAENLVEAEMILELLRKMEIQYANMQNRMHPVTVGVISFYYDQVALIRKMLRAEVFHAINVEVNTVDRFQGKEKEIVFVSLVRNVKRSMHNVDSHIAAFQRINVAFSRAQNLLVIVGARDMYAEQPVKMTDMNNGTEKVVMVYKNIIEMMDHKGTYFTSDEIIPELRATEILNELMTVQGGNEV